MIKSTTKKTIKIRIILTCLLYTSITDPKSDIVEKDNVYVISLENVNLRYMDRYFESRYGERYLGRTLVDTLSYGNMNFEVYDFSVEETGNDG